MKSVLILPDVHLDGIRLPTAYQTVKRFMHGKRFDEIIILGDFLDMQSLSHWTEDNRKEMEGKRFMKEVQQANDEIAFLQRHSKKLVYMEGNHEHWVEEYIEKHPELDGIINLPIQLLLKEKGITWVKENDMYNIGDLHFIHGIYTNQNHAHKHVYTFGCNVVYGHVHNRQSYQINMRKQKQYMATSLGCLCNLNPTWLDNKPNNWINGFGIAYIGDNGHFNLYPVEIINNKFIWGGKSYA